MALLFTSITLNTTNLENMLRFYEILGCRFETVKVTIGGDVHRASFGGLELSLMCTKSAQKTDASQLALGFKVREFEAKIPQLQKVPGVILILDPTDMPDGKKAIFQDPDGHSVELIAF